FALLFAQAEPRPRLRQRGALLLHGQLEFNRRDAREHLAFADAVADIHEHLLDAALGLRADGDFVVGEERADGFDQAALLLLLDGDEFDFRFWQRGARLFAGSVAGGIARAS